jgi:hypothetical protein
VLYNFIVSFSSIVYSCTYACFCAVRKEVSVLLFAMCEGYIIIYYLLYLVFLRSFTFYSDVVAVGFSTLQV